MYYKGYKIRIYPTKKQEELIKKHIGACRFIWNYMLDLQINRYENSKKHLSSYELMKVLTSIKKEEKYYWLNDVSTTSLQKVCTNLSNSYVSFFRKQKGFPKHKSKKKSKPSYPVRSERMYFTEDGCVQIEKIGKIKYKSDFVFQYGKDANFENVHISIDNGKYIVSFCALCENQAPALSCYSMGIDLGIKDLAVVAYNDKCLVFHNINKSKTVRHLKQKLKFFQKSVNRKYEASKRRTGKYVKTNNIKKEELKIRKIYAKISNIRNNYLHQTTANLIAMCPERIVMEDLSVVSLMKNECIREMLQEQCLHEFIRQIKYKCEWNNIQFLQADRFFPSSKTCSCCGSIKSNLKLSDRTYVCFNCGFVADRDYNAALNLMRYKI